MQILLKVGKNAMKNKKKTLSLLLILLFPGGLMLSYLSSNLPDIVESIYSNGFYRIVGQSLSTLTGIFPFSIAEITLPFLIIFAVIRLIHTIILTMSEATDKISIIIGFFGKVLIFVSTIYFIFIIIWGLNYHRLPFSKIAKLDIYPTSPKDLYDVCEDLISRANVLRSEVSEDQNGIMVIPNGYKDVFNRTSKGYERASKIYPELGGSYGKPKRVLLSKAMSYAGISGVYFPFTGEANVNIDIPYSMIPSSACHEMAHQRGFAREDEANYIAYLTCSMSPDADFQYSGALLALINSMNALYSIDSENYFKLRSMYSEGIVRDFSAINEYWKKYEGPVQKMSNSINDSYLKANLQKDGVYSYGRMVDLLIAEYHQRVAVQKNSN